MSELIVITGASGRQASHLLPLLYHDKTYRLRVVCHSTKSVDQLKSKYPDAEVVQADYTIAADCSRIVEGASSVYHVGPAGHEHESEIGYHMIDACSAAASGPTRVFKHFVYSSVLNPQLRKLLNHDCKRYVEEYLAESDIQYTILQPSHFMENVRLAQIAQTGVFSANFDPEVVFTHTSQVDLAEVAYKVIKERSAHFYGSYPIVSSKPTKYTDFIAEISRQLGREVKIERRSFEQVFATWIPMVLGKDAPPRSIDVFERLILYYNKRDLKGNSNVCRWLLGKEPMTIERYVREGLAAIKEG